MKYVSQNLFMRSLLIGDEVLAEQEVATKDVNLTVDEVTLAQALAALKRARATRQEILPPSRGSCRPDLGAHVWICQILQEISQKRTRERMSDQEAKEIKAEAREIMPQPSTVNCS
ncbi:hypothetical protein Tco_0112193 [Tanacetum coccineum]